MAIWAMPASVSKRDVFWFVVVNTILLNLAFAIMVIVAMTVSDGEMAGTLVALAAFAVPLASMLLYLGAQGLRASSDLREDFQRASELLSKRNRELEEARSTLERHANMDWLTGLDNRRAFQTAVKERIAEATRTGVSFWLAIIDLDDFKPINDTHGHDAGDAMLQHVARQLRIQFGGPHVVIARLGGDEFGVILEQETINGFGSAERLIKRACHLLTAPFIYNGQSLRVAASAGLAEWSDEITRPLALMRGADQALISAKMAGKGITRIGEPRPLAQGHDKSPPSHGVG